MLADRVPHNPEVAGHYSDLFSRRGATDGRLRQLGRHHITKPPGHPVRAWCQGRNDGSRFAYQVAPPVLSAFLLALALGHFLGNRSCLADQEARHIPFRGALPPIVMVESTLIAVSSIC